MPSSLRGAPCARPWHAFFCPLLAGGGSGWPLLALGACAWLALHAAGAYAYSDPAQFALDPLEAGGGGHFYTSSPADGYGCESCHVGTVGPDIAIDGLPSRYVSGAVYELRVSWPHALEHAAAMLELTDEQGHGAGSLALPPSNEYEDAELCEPASVGVLSAQLYGAPHERTIAATPDCGATSLRVQWTAPAKNVGPVWLAASVLVSNHDGDLTGDGVTVFAQPVPAYGERLPDQIITGECAAIPVPQCAAPGRLWLTLAVACVLLWHRRALRPARMRGHVRRVIGVACAFLAVVLVGCDSELPASASVELARGPAVRPWDGGRVLTDVMDSGAGALDASADGNDAGLPGASLDAGSVPLPVPTRVVFRITTLPQGGRYEPKNIGAIWVQDGEGRFVKALARWAGVRLRYLTAFNTANTTQNLTDAITSATLREHVPHEVVWDLRTANGDSAPDGSYSIVTEVTDDDGPGETISVSFTKPGEAASIHPEDGEYFIAIELAYE